MRKKAGVSKKDIEAVKKIHIPDYFADFIVENMGSYYNGRNTNLDNQATALCPIHDEDTESFRYYADSNTYYCFGGCGSGGDIITLHTRFMSANKDEDISFVDAVLFLKGRYIDGNKSDNLFTELKIANNEQCIVNTATDVAKFNYAVNKLRLRAEKSKDRLTYLMDFIENYRRLMECNGIESVRAIAELESIFEKEGIKQ